MKKKDVSRENILSDYNNRGNCQVLLKEKYEKVDIGKKEVSWSVKSHRDKIKGMKGEPWWHSWT